MFKVPQVMNSSFKADRRNDNGLICIEDIESGDESIVFFLPLFYRMIWLREVFEFAPLQDNQKFSKKLSPVPSSNTMKEAHH